MANLIHPGQRVRVRPFSEIAATLDKDSKLGSVPFTAQMVSFCGSEFRVLRRLSGDGVGCLPSRNHAETLILEGACCDGTGRDRCQRRCPMLWKEAWLKVASERPLNGCGVDRVQNARACPLDPEGWAGLRSCQAAQLGMPFTYLFPAVVGQSLSLAEYARSHEALGLRTHPGASGTWWLQYEIGAMMRFPIFATASPSAEELRYLHWARFAPLVSYLVQPTSMLPADACVYICTNSRYSLKELDHSVQGNVKRGLRDLEIRPITLDEVQQLGEPAFLDIWRQHGWLDVSGSDFQEYFSRPQTLCGNRFFGAFRRNALLAYVGVIELDDWAEVRVRFSTEASLSLRPNDALLFYVLAYYLVERGFRTVSAGVSSILPSANTPGLHRFKIKMGFDALPVRRVFLFHPSLRLFVSRSSLRLLRGLAKRAPGNQRLALAEHALEHALCSSPSPQFQ